MVKFPLAVAGQAVETGSALGVPIAADVDLPAWGQDVAGFYPFTACLPDAGWLVRVAFHDKNSLLTIPTAHTSPLADQIGMCAVAPGASYPTTSPSFPLPASLSPVATTPGDIPSPNAAVLQVFGRNLAYFAGDILHSGTDFRGRSAVQTSLGTFPPNTVFLPYPCEPLCVRAGIIVCATPMPNGWSGTIPPPATWGLYWEGDGLTLLHTYLHMNTCNATGGILAAWENSARVVAAGKPFAEANSMLIPPAGGALATYCAAPTWNECGTDNPHLHFQVAVVTNDFVRSYLQGTTGATRIQPQSGCLDGNRYTCPGMWWAGITKEAVSGHIFYVNPDQVVSISPSAASCFGTTAGNLSLRQIISELRSASPSRIPTPAEIIVQHGDTLARFKAWYNSILIQTPNGPAAPVVRFPCTASSYLMAYDIGFVGGYPANPDRGYSSNCYPSYPPLPSYKCETHRDYIPSRLNEVDLSHQEYNEAAARALFFFAWHSVYGPH